MAVGNYGDSSSKNYYGIAYGMLGQNRSEVLDGYSEVTQEELESKTSKKESIDLRMKYVSKPKSKNPYRHFFGFVDGTINSISTEETDNGIFLSLTIDDNDIVQVKLYSQYAENLLNRLCNIDSFDGLRLAPYAIPNSFQDEGGKKVLYYVQGVSVNNGAKIEPKYAYDSTEMPKTERIKGADGKMVTSRVARIDFLLEQVQAKIGSELEETTEAPF
jgi:hypothetical protein